MIELAIVALCVVGIILGAIREWRLWREYRLTAHGHLADRAAHQERLARLTIRTGSTDVQAAPRLVPLADVLPFPDRDGNEAA